MSTTHGSVKATMSISTAIYLVLIEISALRQRVGHLPTPSSFFTFSFLREEGSGTRLHRNDSATEKKGMEEMARYRVS